MISPMAFVLAHHGLSDKIHSHFRQNIVIDETSTQIQVAGTHQLRIVVLPHTLWHPGQIQTVYGIQTTHQVLCTLPDGRKRDESAFQTRLSEEIFGALEE
jgi:hypothetical protein